MSSLAAVLARLAIAVAVWPRDRGFDIAAGTLHALLHDRAGRR